MKPTATTRNKFSVFATTPCRGLFLSRSMVVRGVSLNEHTHCAHYHSERDVVAVRFKCCDAFYACIHCHEELAGHMPVVWGEGEREAHAIFCGNCHKTLSIAEYLDCRNCCPLCGAPFNPQCAQHYDLYFEL